MQVTDRRPKGAQAVSSFFLEWTERKVKSKRKCGKTASSMLPICQLFEIHACESKRHLRFNLQQTAQLCVTHPPEVSPRGRGARLRR